MQTKIFIYMISAFCLVFTMYNCSQTKKTMDETVEKYIVLCKDAYIPKKEDFAPFYTLKDVVKVNKTLNEWMITIQSGEKPIDQAMEYIKSLRFVVKVKKSSTTSNSSSNSQKKSNININN
jgi:hypothetical protein